MKSFPYQLACAFVCSALGLLSACQQPPEALPVRSLVASGDVTYVCRNPAGEGVPIEDCPDFDHGENELYALVTQTLTAEVAGINITRGKVVDVDRTAPGFTFLKIGRKPVDIVTTPGGQVSFVGVAAVGSEGIFAIPTTCIGAPREKSPGVFETPRDLTTWPACSLPSAPGQMAVLVDPPDDEGRMRLSCDSSDRVSDLPEPMSASRECAVDLRKETRVPGRRKLAVALPEFGEIALIDAQTMLDESEPGSFGPCPIERTYPLSVDLPNEPVEQRIPEDLNVPGCTPFTVDYPHQEGPFQSRPAGFALADDGSLFVADRGAPVIHDLDVHDPCDVRERDPLLPLSMLEPNRVVTTTKVAVSPRLTDGSRFLYAIDEYGRSTANVMAFDLTPGQADRTPIVRSGTPFLPFEPADRISFVAPAQDLVFARRDLPIADSVVGEAVVGTRCDPDPSIDTDAPGALYRPNSNRTSGAGPRNLRGVFGFVLLTSGQVGVVDVEDYDEACRRPIYSNNADALDFRGCAGDPQNPEFYTLPDGQDESGQPTVTNEVSCRIVQPHRARAGHFALTSSSAGVGAPSLRSFPRLTFEDRGLPMNDTEEGKKYPKILAVDYPDPTNESETLPAKTYVGTTLYSSIDEDKKLETDPTTSQRGSVVLPWIEPRAYASEERVVVTYEGAIGAERPSGFLKVGEADSDSVEDADARFCDAGVQGARLTQRVGQERFNLSGKALAEFAEQHADYVQVTQDLLPSDDEYWQSGVGASCGGRGYQACEEVFGVVDDSLDLLPGRELRIVSSYQDRLVVEPRNTAGEEAKREQMALLDCCFPTGTSYKIRASDEWVVQGSVTGFRHRVVPTRVDTDNGPIYPCDFDCSPAKRYFEGRAFEVSEDSDLCRSVPVDPTKPGSECIYDSLTSRFAIYRGEEPSERGMTFFYTVAGGFSPLSISLTRNDTSIILPQTLTRVPGFDMLAAVDAQDRGLMLLSLDTLGVIAPSPFY